MPEAAQNQIQNQIKKKLVHTFSPLFKDKKLQIHKNYINKVNVESNCASNTKKIIFYFCKSMEYYFIKG
jgi:hypothetical protein